LNSAIEHGTPSSMNSDNKSCASPISPTHWVTVWLSDWLTETWL
jgi:hypothetical protein